jgi:hypothetical protein
MRRSQPQLLGCLVISRVFATQIQRLEQLAAARIQGCQRQPQPSLTLHLFQRLVAEGDVRGERSFAGLTTPGAAAEAQRLASRGRRQPRGEARLVPNRPEPADQDREDDLGHVIARRRVQPRTAGQGVDQARVGVDQRLPGPLVSGQAARDQARRVGGVSVVVDHRLSPAPATGVCSNNHSAALL